MEFVEQPKFSATVLGRSNLRENYALKAAIISSATPERSISKAFHTGFGRVAARIKRWKR